MLLSANTTCQLRLSWFFSLGHPFCLSFESCASEMWKTTKLQKGLTMSCPSSLWIWSWITHKSSQTENTHPVCYSRINFMGSCSYCFFIVLDPWTWKERVFWSLKYCVNIRMPLPHWTTINNPYIRSETKNESPLWQRRLYPLSESRAFLVHIY